MQQDYRGGEIIVHIKEPVSYRVLETVGVELHGRHFSLTAAKPRSILALLMLNVNDIVPTSTLFEELWGDQLPRSAHNTLQTYIHQIRQWLSKTLRVDSTVVSNELVVTEPGGYRFRIRDRQQLDLGQFECYFHAGVREFARHNYQEAVSTLNALLKLWSGQTAVGTRPGGATEAVFTHLREKRLRALEDRVDAELILGRHREVLGELSSHVINHPLDESMHAKLMIAFYRSGRVPDALRTYQRLRRSLVEDLGLEPSAKLRDLHQAILAEDPRLKFRLPIETGILTAIPANVQK
jgi:SARP family transcriptional regulator, regulator of embCAB operon